MKTSFVLFFLFFSTAYAQITVGTGTDGSYSYDGKIVFPSSSYKLFCKDTYACQCGTVQEWAGSGADPGLVRMITRKFLFRTDKICVFDPFADL